MAPAAYQSLMLLHVYSADLIMLLIPFTKIAHCVLAPLSQVVTAMAWKFPAGAGDRVAATLGYADRPAGWQKPGSDGCGGRGRARRSPEMKAAILTDTTKCIGCHECVVACKKQNHLAADIPRRWDLDDGLSASNWTSVVEGPSMLCPQAVPPLPGAGLRLGLPGGRPA